MRSRVSAIEEKMDAWIAGMKDSRKERTACQEATEANPEEMESEAEHREVSKEHAAVETGKAPSKQQRD
jgi:hypothetical protein